MAKVLAVASTPYHLMTFLFIKDAFLSEDTVDLVITDKTPMLFDLYQKGRFDGHFHQVLFADGRKIKNPYKSAVTTFFESFIYNKTTTIICDKPLETYDQLFFASPGMPDEIVKELAKTLIKKNKNITFHRYEDGFASYTKKPMHIVNTSSGMKMYKTLFRYDILKKEQDIYLFEPDFAMDFVSFHRVQIPKTKERMERIIRIIQDIFQDESHNMEFPQDFLFLGQGAQNSSNNPDTYRDLINRIGQMAGKDNFIIKPHPRGIYDDFSPTFSTYKNNAPLEIAIANGYLENKTLLSFYSTACFSAKLLFQSNCRIIFIYPLSADAFNEKIDYEEYFHKFEKKYDQVFIARSFDELEALLPGQNNKNS